MEVLEIILLAVAVIVVAGAGWYLISRRRSDFDRTADEQALRAPASGPALPMDDRLSKTSRSLGGALRSVFGRGSLDQQFWDGLEEALIGADVGVGPATAVVDRVRAGRPATTAEARDLLRRHLVRQLDGRDRALSLGESKPAVVMVVGVNGAGKTTTIAKLAHRMTRDGLIPLLGAADTFRAAADAQLRTWGDRLGTDVVGGQEGADPAAVAFDAYQAARSRGRDVVMIDTAGRLQSKHNLMAELAKIRRVLEKETDTIDEVLLVLDATAGQNGISQVREFARAVGVTGIVLTKLDGTARGGVVVAVESELDVPVKYIGLGEGLEDLIEFDPADFVKALLADA